jgi:Family of unknown function (DUF6152)
MAKLSILLSGQPAGEFRLILREANDSILASSGFFAAAAVTRMPRPCAIDGGAKSMKARTALMGIALALISGAIPLLAHHSFAAEYDANKPIKVTGVVTKMEWMNPHARFYVDVKDADGKVTNWNFELGAIPVLLKQGWRKTSLKEGDQVTVECVMAKDGSNNGSARRVTLPDGRRVFGGSALDEPSNPPNQ